MDPDQMPHSVVYDLGLHYLSLRTVRVKCGSITTPDKGGYPHNIFLVSPQKHML